MFSELRAERSLGVDDLVLLADSAWWLGLIQETLGLTEECYEAYVAAADLERAASLAIENAFNWFLRGEPAVGSGWISRARRILEGLPECAEHGFLLWLEASELLEHGELDAVRDIGRQLREMAARFESPVLGSFGLVFEALVEIRTGNAERGFGLLDEAMLPVVAGRLEPEWAGNLYCQMMSICHDLAEVARARQWTTATERWCGGFPAAAMFVGICRVHRTQLLRLEGDWDAAVGQASAAAAELADLNVEAVAEAQYELGEVHRLRGDLSAARAAYDAALRLGRDPEPGATLLLLAEGRAEEAANCIHRLLSEVTDPFKRTRLLRAQAEVACSRGEIETADAAASELRTIAATYRTAGFLAWSEEVDGTVLFLQHRPDDALDPLRAALDRYKAMGATYDAALTRVRLARVYDALGDSDAARAEASAATRTFEVLGAGPPATARLGGTGALPGGLTAREAEVVAAIAEGLTNRQVAARLVISEKTVARHLANVYTKLGVNSRTAAAAWAYQKGLVGAPTYRPA